MSQTTFSNGEPKNGVGRRGGDRRSSVDAPAASGELERRRGGGLKQARGSIEQGRAMAEPLKQARGGDVVGPSGAARAHGDSV
jgi:hypothetical protein